MDPSASSYTLQTSGKPLYVDFFSLSPNQDGQDPVRNAKLYEVIRLLVEWKQTQLLLQ